MIKIRTPDDTIQENRAGRNLHLMMKRPLTQKKSSSGKLHANPGEEEFYLALVKIKPADLEKMRKIIPGFSAKAENTAFISSRQLTDALKQEILTAFKNPDSRENTVQEANGLYETETELQFERLSLVASKTNNAVFITNELGKTVWINESVERLTGFGIAELIGKTPGEILQGPDTDKHAIERIRLNLRQHKPVSEVVKNYRKDGSFFWINMDIAPIFKGGKLVNFIGIGADVTELVHAREAEKEKNILEQQQKLFNAIARNFPDGIIGVLDGKLHYVFAGGSEIRKLGLDQDAFIGNNIFDHLSEQSNEKARPFLERAVAGESVNFEADMLGNIYNINAVPLLDEEQKTKMILVVLYNITERKKAELDVQAALAKQTELNELKSKFVSIASHEFRTPLSTILSSTFLISKYTRTNEPQKAEKHIERIEVAISALTDILNDFLSLSRMEEGKLENNPGNFDAVEFCHAVVEEIQATIRKGQTIAYQHVGGITGFMLDRQLLKNVLLNLLSNASKYSAENKTIWLESGIKDGRMYFSVRDEGIGIPEVDQPRLFQTFFRANNAANIQGTGMGLHIIRRFLDIMGGEIVFKSKENQGSLFTVSFPLC